MSENYLATSRELLIKAGEALAHDDLVQASEKGWGAAAQAVKAVGERRGLRHNGHRELFLIVNRLVEETGDQRLRHFFQTANSLHSNFYENWLPREFITDGLAEITEFINRVESLNGS